MRGDIIQAVIAVLHGRPPHIWGIAEIRRHGRNTCVQADRSAVSKNSLHSPMNLPSYPAGIAPVSVRVATLVARCTAQFVQPSPATLEKAWCSSARWPAPLLCGRDAEAASPPGDVVGKITVGYQGWFSAAGDGSPVNAWGHSNLEMWPDVRAYVTTYSGCPFLQDGVGHGNFTGNLGNGKPATMFSSYDQQVVNTHLSWMAQYGIDCCALQRFGNEISPGSTLKAQRDGMAQKFMSAAQANGVKFYIMYDSSATDAIQSDWTNTIVGTLHLTSSPNYAKQNGKPVVCLYGVCQSGRGTPTDWQTRINWFKSQGCYVIGGCAGFSPSNPANVPAYTALNMILPWRVGALGNLVRISELRRNGPLILQCQWHRLPGLYLSRHGFCQYQWPKRLAEKSDSAESWRLHVGAVWRGKERRRPERLYCDV